DRCPNDGLGRDMVENYMDYTNDACMNIFTNDQVSRMLTVLENSPGISELPFSTTGDVEIMDLDASIKIENLNVANCSDYSITPELKITNRGNNTLTSATVSYNLDNGTSLNINWTGSLAYSEFEIIYVPEISVALGAHTFNVSLSNPNGGTDEQMTNNTHSSNFTITGTACASVASTQYGTSTTGVIFNTISNLNTGKPSGYSDYTTMSTDVNRDSSYNLTVNANSDGNYQVITYAWIDWNQNCSFDDPGEQYNLGTSGNINNQPTTNSPLSITVPTNAVLGSTTMRITTKYTDPGANDFPTACEMNHDAEVEDYTVNVLAQLSVEEFTLNSISLYPNPATNVLNISLANKNDLPDNYSVYNMLGQVILTKRITNESDLSIDASNLSNGMYFIKIAKGSNQVSLPFIKK
ncbi:MAG TPA: zinc-dependent metalloprotease, partial [Xanthomarina sp.]|nr:zinc-dependent metalloprotease [Xanthomarina sp.]